MRRLNGGDHWRGGFVVGISMVACVGGSGEKPSRSWNISLEHGKTKV